MEQHPIPQQISSYEFRLVGDMTLKQFAQLAGGGVIALVFYASPLPWYFKWPFIFLFAFAGVAMAFLPLGERPLQTWVIAFLKAIYSPTQFLWQKQAQKPEIFEEKVALSPKTLPSPVFPGDKNKLTEYLSSLPAAKEPLEQKEEELLSQIKNLFITSQIKLPAETSEEKPTMVEDRRPADQLVAEEVAPQVLPKYTPPPPTVAAKFSPQIPMPSIPEIPNILVGTVLDKEGKIVEGAILEIRDSQGNPVRALRTNKLGQFRIATPLANNTYEIETEKEGLEFDIVKVELKGEIVQPIEIRAREKLTQSMSSDQMTNDLKF